ncbi:MAG: EamA family transporter [Saprospiraceae bacterium]|nr:EamA family transporter [Saprospiraceae bacterium]
MNWLQFSLITVVLYSIHDITLKHLAGSVNSTLASVLINGSAAIVLFIYLLTQTSAGKISLGAPLWSATTFFLLVAGASLGIATITFMNAFASDGQLSIAVPVVYAGVIVLCLLMGVLFFSETLHWKQLIGAGLAIAGIYLMSAPK